MSHSDPLFAIPAGTVLALGCLYLLLRPERVMELDTAGWPRTLERLLGRRGAVLVLRTCALLTGLGSAALVVHATRSLLGW